MARARARSRASHFPVAHKKKLLYGLRLMPEEPFRSAWVKCILTGARETLCGRKLQVEDEWVFLDVEHARATIRSGSKLSMCPECFKKIPGGF
jgi:hypothetical protein